MCSSAGRSAPCSQDQRDGRQAAVRRQRARGAALPCDGDTTRGFLTRMMPWIGAGGSRSARLARSNKPLRCRPLEGRRDQKSPLRRCFKPRPPLRAGYAGFASGCRSSVFGAANDRELSVLANLGFLRSRSGRLSGLLSGCPPTDTRPQARAKLGEAQLIAVASLCKGFFGFDPKLSRTVSAAPSTPGKPPSRDRLRQARRHCVAATFLAYPRHFLPPARLASAAHGRGAAWPLSKRDQDQ